MRTLNDCTICPANPEAHSGMMTCPCCAGYGTSGSGFDVDDIDCDMCDGQGSIPGPMPSPLACARLTGWHPHIRLRLAFSGARLAAGTDCRTQDEFATLARLYGAPL